MPARNTLQVLLGTGVHADRPAAGDVGAYGLYACTDHRLIYQTDGSTWSTWAVQGGGTTAEAIEFVIDGGGSALTAGVKGYVYMPFDCTITAVVMLGDQSGSVVVDIWKDVYANYPPTNADSITAAANPTISSGVKSLDSTLTGWTTAVTAGDVIGFNVDSATAITLLTVALLVTR